MAATIIIMMILAGSFVLGIRESRRRIHSGCCGSGGDSVKRVKAGDPNKKNYPFDQRLSIGGMHCKNCTIRVENALNEMDGVLAEVNLGRKEALVHMKQEIPASKLIAAVCAAGYDADLK